MKQYWGSQGQYGPFSPQEDGWPNRGEVIRHYRTAVKKMSAEYLGHVYGMKTLGRPLSERWIQMLEKQNLVPKDESKRRALAEILGIPLILLGLGRFRDLQPAKKASVSHVEVGTLPHYTTMLDLYWMLDYTSTAQSSLTELETVTSDLRQLALHAGDSAAKVYELLCGFYPLLSTIYSDQQKYAVAFDTANQAVSVADEMKNNKYKAVALYQRGFVNLQRGQGNLGQVDKTYLRDAISDFDAALPLAIPRVEIGILMDQARAYALLKQRSAAISALNKAGKIIARKDLRDGSFMDLFANVDVGRHHLGRGAVFVLLGETDEAESELEIARDQVLKDQTRRHAWIDILSAQNLLAQKEYVIAATTALAALRTSLDVKSGYNMSLIGDIYASMPEKVSTEKTVRELGAALLHS